MAIEKWQPGKLYVAGSLVIPTASASESTDTVIPNAGFESGDVNWTKDTGWAINSNSFFAGAIGAEYSGPGAGAIVSDTKHAVAPGTEITAQCFIEHGASADGEANGSVILRWYTAADVFVSDSVGNNISTGAAGVWRKSIVVGICPPTAAKVAIGVSAYNDWAPMYADNFQWDYVSSAAAAVLAYKASGNATEAGAGASYGPATDINFETFSGAAGIRTATANWAGLGFIAGYGHKITVVGSTSNDGDYDAVSVGSKVIATVQSVVTEAAGASITVTQPGAPGGGSVTNGTSGATEPIWPLEIGGTVLDGTVIWEAIGVDSITWEASSIMTSGSSEPTWPTGGGDYVSDNNIAWETTPLRIEDENCPHTKVVAIAASKVFAGDTDVVRFCATLNARDWTSDDDAGFLPTGLQQKSQAGVNAMGVYRGNLSVWSASTFQVWQIDPDPAAMSLLDAMEGIGSIHQQAVQPVSDDLFFLAALGVRTVSIAEGTNNLASGDVGVPIDELIRYEANQIDVEPIASYYPSGGQFWLAFRPLTIAATLLAGQFLLTSPPYPIEVIDAVTHTVTPMGGRAFRPQWSDAVTYIVTPLKGEKPFGIDAYDAPPDAVTHTVTPLNSINVARLVEISNYEDAVTHTVTPQDGIKEYGLIIHDQPAEKESVICTVTPQDGYKI